MKPAKQKKCPACRGPLQPTTTEVPFPRAGSRTLIIRNLPVLQCGKCHDFVIEESTMAKVDLLLDAPPSAHVEIINFVD